MVVMMGLAGAMSAAGMRTLVASLIDKGYIDCLVATGANLFHDIYESFGHHHFLGSPEADDEELFERARELLGRLADVPLAGKLSKKVVDLRQRLESEL